MDKGFAKAKKHIADWKKQKLGELELDADDTALRAELAGAMKTVTAYQKAGTKAGKVSLDGDNSGLLRSVASARAALSGIPNEKNVTIDANTRGAIRSVGLLRNALTGG